VLKLSSNRLKEKNYRIELSLEEARKNNEVVRLGESELIRAIRRVRGKEFSQELLDSLLKEKLHLSRKQNSPENRKAIQEVSEKVDQILYIEDLVILHLDDVRHYKRIIEQGLFVNNIRFVRLLCGAGHSRRSTVFLCREDIFKPLNEILECGRNPNIPINANKYNAYLGLCSSATSVVSRPVFVVVPDCEIKRIQRVDWFTPQGEGIDPTFEEKDIEQTINLFDGEGLISPNQALVWAEDLGIGDSYRPASFIFRTAYSKGLLVTFDFHKFAQEYSIKKIIDIYSVEHWVDDVEVILTLSQFKMASGYTSLEEYNYFSKKFGWEWGVSRCSPKNDKSSATITYQYLQALNIKDGDIEKICKPTIEWLQSITGLDYRSVLIFLLGDLENFSNGDFKSADYLAKVILLEPGCLKDSHIRKKLFHFANKKIRESYTGVLNVLGHYAFAIADPYGLAQHALGLEVTGLLPKELGYSQYWKSKRINKISLFRSPMTWRSEHISIDLDENEKEWYTYINSGIIFNLFNDWPLRLSGQDYDGDIILTTPEFTELGFEDLPIPTYDRKTADKTIIKNEELWKADTRSFGTKVGIITNIGSTLFSMLSNFTDEMELETIVNRIKTTNILQNMTIDSAKGIETYRLPNYWDKWSKIGDNAELYNKLLARQRPYFFRYLYSSWSRKFKHHYNSYDNVAIVRFGFSLETLLKKQDLSESEQKVKDEFYSRSPLIDNKSIMNSVCRFMENAVHEMKLDSKKSSFDWHIYLNPNYPTDENKIDRMEIIYQKWVAFQRNSHDRPEEIDDESEIPTKDEYLKVLEREAYEISNNISEISNAAVELCYGRHGENSKEFCWRLFGGQGIIDALFERARGFIQTPLLDPNGDYEYLGKRFKLENIVLEKE
jgi:hypothetical protein